LVFASNWINELPQTFNGPIWSVSVEVLVYVFFFIVVSFLRPSLVLCVVVAAVAKAASHFYPQYVFECIQYFFVGGVLQELVAFCVCVLGLCLSIATSFRFWLDHRLQLLRRCVLRPAGRGDSPAPKRRDQGRGPDLRVLPPALSNSAGRRFGH